MYPVVRDEADFNLTAPSVADVPVVDEANFNRSKASPSRFRSKKIKKNSLNHCARKIEACEFLWISSKRLRRINKKNQFIERIVGLSIKTNKRT